MSFLRRFWHWWIRPENEPEPPEWVTEGGRLVMAMHKNDRDDLIEHDTGLNGEDCICGPKVEPVKHDDGQVTWLITHHQLSSKGAKR